MRQTASVYDQVLDYSNRPNPYPLYAELRRIPVSREEDGTCVVSTYQEIAALLHDPRISSDLRNLSEEYYRPAVSPGEPGGFIRYDPPHHDRVRRQAMRHFGPPHDPGRIDSMRPWLAEVVTALIDRFGDRNRVDIVDDFAYPFPVTVICRLLGVPREDEPRFRGWVDVLVEAIDPRRAQDAEQLRKRDQALAEFGQYLAELVEAHRRQPGDDLLSGLVADPGPDGSMSQGELLGAARLLLIAGHETTVNLITNGMLTLLRHPGVLERLRHEPDLVIGTVEELLRYEPPVHLIPWRAALDDIDIAGTTIPKGSPVALVLAAGNRDPRRFQDPDRFDPEREDNAHLGFGGGIHLCFGAPLARTEAQIALTEIARRLENPRLVEDPPQYRESPVLRGPRHLLVEFEGVTA
ncbi:MAG TPA: cytochrome P450 [Candidatus Dormibacteraeota bacterium]|nr:cytochrome P450 [Candidatus Dormibacteraeota bacterium]